MTKGEGWFIINARTRIVAQDDAAARNVASQIRDEIKRRWQLDVPVHVEGGEGGGGFDDVIYLGQLWRGGVAEQLRKDADLEIPSHPQGYGLSVSPRKVVILGKDSDGLYWGVQSFMLAMRWRNSKDATQNGLGVHCLKAEDWPATLDRAIFFTEGSPFGAIEPEIHRLFDTIHLQTRFKWNVTYGAPDDPTPSHLIWSPGRQAEFCREIREKHHMEMRPMLMTPPAYNLGGWDRIVAAANDYSIVESSPDESSRDLGKALNLCPLNPRSYELANAKIDHLIETYGHPSKMWLGGIVNHDPLVGSRWGACRDCFKSGKSKSELFVFFAERLASHLRTRNCVGVVEPHNIVFGNANDLKWRRALIVSDFSELPKDFTYILPQGFSPAKSESLSGVMSPSFTCDGASDWPSAERLFRSPLGNDIHTIEKFGDTLSIAGGVRTLEQMWYGSDPLPKEPVNTQELFVYGNCWHFCRDLPSWRAGERPGFHTIDLRKFANYNGRPTGTETFESGRMPAMDLRYVPTGKLVLSGVEFDLIDPAENDGKSVMMLGRPLQGVTHAKDFASVAETSGPIPVGKKLASIAFLTAGWQASMQEMARHEKWLMPTCRVIYEDDTWLVVDSYRVFTEWDYWNKASNYSYITTAGYPKLLERTGWLGNSPTGTDVWLKVNEWVNPYPEKVVKSLHYVTPTYEGSDGSKRTNPECLGVVAISGVEPIQQDFDYWAKRVNRVPLLPPIREAKVAAVPLERVGLYARQGTNYIIQFKPAAGGGRGGDAANITSTLDVTPDVKGVFYDLDRLSLRDCGYVANNANYKPFSVVQSFATPVQLSRIDVRGPTYGVDHEYSFGRPHKLDVTVEISEDSATWRKVGELKGISGDADFLPVEFAPVNVAKIRFTATAEPYRAEYAAGMAHAVARLDYPYFVWRVLTPTE